MLPSAGWLRSVLLVLLLSMPAPAAWSAPAARAKVTQKVRPKKVTTVELFHINRKETMRLSLRDERGRSVRGVQKRFDRFLRCHYTNVQKRMSPRLMNLIYKTGRRWPGRLIEVVSGYRHPNVAKNPRSPHMQGLAADFRVVGIPNTELRDYLRGTFQRIGVGYYPNSSFVHVDVRKDRSAFWIDYSGPGERSMYAENPAEDLKTGRADQYRPTRIDQSWVNDAPPDKDNAPPDRDDAPPPPGTEPEVNKPPPAPVQAGPETR